MCLLNFFMIKEKEEYIQMYLFTYLTFYMFYPLPFIRDNPSFYIKNI